MGRGRHRHAGQAGDARIRHGRPELRPALAAGAQSVEPGAFHRRARRPAPARRSPPGMILGGTGSDTGGSIRGPAALCGLAGIKPTYGLCSRAGVLPLSFTMDHTGPLAWTVEDCALLLQAMAGHDPDDPASADRPVPDFTADLDQRRQGAAHRRGAAFLRDPTIRSATPRGSASTMRWMCSEHLGAEITRRHAVADGGLQRLRLADPDRRGLRGARTLAEDAVQRLRRVAARPAGARRPDPCRRLRAGARAAAARCAWR